METHEYVELLFSSLSAAMWFSIFEYLPLVKTFKRFLVDKKILGDRVRYSKWIATKVAARREREENPDRPDLMTDILANNGAKGSKLTDLEMNSNASLLITAGSETTATLLSGATYLLLRNPEKLAKLQEEIRSAFSSYDEIKLDAVNRLPYTNAVLTESLRVFPPVPVGFVRQVGAGGEVISGHYIPEGTAVSVSQYAANHSEANFVNAEEFIPERWLEDSQYASDKKSVLQPFSFGPRACLGRSLANAEMRLILAKTIWSFDMRLEERSLDWLERCTVMRLWIKPELAVKLTPVERK
jgi:cytochrome P450